MSGINIGVPSTFVPEAKIFSEFEKLPRNLQTPASLVIEKRMEVPCNEEDETSLVVSAASGDTDAFTRLFHRYHAMIYAFNYRLCLCMSDAQDITQETFIRAARSLGSFRGESSFKNWLYRIAVNASRDCLRGNQRRQRLAEEFTQTINESHDPQPHGRQEPVAEALAALPEELRRAIVLVYYEEMNHAEAAKVLGCAETTVSWRIFRAKGKLKHLLEKKGGLL